MSIRALCLGVEKRLRSAAVFNDMPDAAVGKFVGVQPAPGKPPANFGQWYAAVWFGGARGTDALPERSDQLMNLNVTLTFRLNYSPPDRRGKQLTAAAGSPALGMYAVADTVAAAIHGNIATVNQYVNELIPGTAAYVAIHGGTATVNGFCELLVLSEIPTERPAPGDWMPEGSKDVYVMDIRFKDARRIQRIYG